MKVILISGKAEHGKDTAALALKSILETKGKKVLIARYGGLVKYTCETFFDWDGKKNEKGRGLLQEVGTDGIREQYPDFWVDYVAKIIRIFHHKWDYVLIPDCRFPNEIDYYKADSWWNWTTLRINRPNFKSILTEEQLSHISETALDNYEFDYYIKAESGIDNVKDEVEKIIDSLL